MSVPLVMTKQPASTRVLRISVSILMALAALLCFAGLGRAEPVTVHNTDQPADGIDKMEFEEVWRAGGDDDEFFFGTISGIDTDQDGNIYVLDGQLSEIQVYTADGEHVNTLSREGDGPGETRDPGALLITSDNLIHILQTFPGKAVVIDRQDTPSGSYAFTPAGGSQAPFTVMLGLQEDRDGLLILGVKQAFDNARNIQTNFVARCDRQGNELQMLLEKEHIVDFSDFRFDEGAMDFVWARTTVDDDGNVYIAAARNEYSISVYDTDGNETRRISRDFTPPARTDEQKKVARQVMEAVGAYYPPQLLGTTIEDHEPVVTSLWVHPDKSLWVANSHNRADDPDGAFLVVDEFTEEGKFQRQVALMCDGDNSRDAFFPLGNGLFVVVTGALDAWLNQQAVSGEEGAETANEKEATPLEIICYRAK